MLCYQLRDFGESMPRRSWLSGLLISDVSQASSPGLAGVRFTASGRTAWLGCLVEASENLTVVTVDCLSERGPKGSDVMLPTLSDEGKMCPVPRACLAWHRLAWKAVGRCGEGNVAL